MPTCGYHGVAVNSAGRIAVVGASLAGVRLIKALRRKGFSGDIVLIGEEDELPYDRPPLSKNFLIGDDPVAPRPLEPESFYDDVELRLGTRATGLDPRTGAVQLADGSSVRADYVVIATGAGSRTLPAVPDGDRVSRLRTVADARRIRAAMSEASSLLVVGGGFIGCEVAASARARGLSVTIVEPLSAPVVRGVGEFVGGLIADLHRERGVDFRLGVAVERVHESSQGLDVTLTDGSRLEAGFAVVGVGAIAATGWLDRSGLAIADGLLCDDRGRVDGGAGHVWAAGDVAAWRTGPQGQARRVEHWTNAAEQASVLATNLLDDTSTVRHDPVPYVWSDQYEHKIQILGGVRGDDQTTLLQGSFEERRFAVAYSRAGRLTGMVAFNLPREIAVKRSLVAESVPMTMVT